MQPDKRRVLFLLCVNNLGGAELSVLAIAKGLRMRGWNVAMAIYGTQCALIEGDDLDIIHLPATRTLSALLPLIHLLRREPVAMLVTALRYTNMLGIVTAWISRSRTRVIITEHSTTSFLAGKGWKQRCILPLMGWIYPKANAIVAASQGIAADIKGLLLRPCEIRVIYNPVMTGIADTSPAPHSWLAGDGIPAIIAIGRLSREKDFATLLRAFALLLANRPAHLIIAGEGPERPALEQLAGELGIENHVLFAGFVKPVSAWLRRANLFVSSSRFEGFGNAIVEAMACRVPVIAADCPVGPAEILENGRFGQLVPVGDAAAMAAAMEARLAQPSDPEAAYNRAMQFTDTRCIDAYAALLGSIA
jgi:glycosyltransferase involved in cell wall biosynthesis